MLLTWLLLLLGFIAQAPLVSFGSYSAALPIDAEILLAMSPDWSRLYSNFSSGRLEAATATVIGLGRQATTAAQMSPSTMASLAVFEGILGLHSNAARAACLMRSVAQMEKPAHPELVLVADWACIRLLARSGQVSSALLATEESNTDQVQSPAWPLLAAEIANVLADVGAHEPALHLRRLTAAHLTQHVGSIREALQLSLGASEQNKTAENIVELPLRALYSDWREQVQASASSVSPAFRASPPQVYSWRIFMRDLGLHLQQMDHRSAAMYLLATAVTERKGLQPTGPDLDWALPMLRVLYAQSRSFVAGLGGIGPRSATLHYIGSTGNFAHDGGTALWRQALDRVSAGEYAAAHRSMQRVKSWDESIGLGAVSNPETLNALAYLELEQQLFLEAKETATAAVEAVYGNVGEELAPRTLQWMRATYLSATASWGQGMLQEAADLYKRVAQSVRSAYGRHHVLYATALTEFCYIKEEMMVEQMLNKCVEEEDAMVARCVVETDGTGCHDGKFLAPGCDAMELQLSAAERTLVLLDKAVARWHRVENYRLNLDWQHLAKRRQLMATRVKLAATAAPLERAVLGFILDKEHSWRGIRSLYHSASEAVVRVLGQSGEAKAASDYAKASLAVLSDHLHGAWSRGIMAPSYSSILRAPLNDGPHAFDVPGARGGHMPLQGEQLVRALERLHAANAAANNTAAACKQSDEVPSLQKWAACNFPGTAVGVHLTTGSLVELRQARSAALKRQKAGPTGAWTLPKQQRKSAGTEPAAFWGGEGLVGDVFNFLERVAPSAQLSPEQQSDQLMRRCRSARVQDTTLLYVQLGFTAQGTNEQGTEYFPASNEDGTFAALSPDRDDAPLMHMIDTLQPGGDTAAIANTNPGMGQSARSILLHSLMGSQGGVLNKAENLFRSVPQITYQVGPAVANLPSLDCSSTAEPPTSPPRVHDELQPLVDKLWGVLHANEHGAKMVHPAAWQALVRSKAEMIAAQGIEDTRVVRQMHLNLLQTFNRQEPMSPTGLCDSFMQQSTSQNLVDSLAVWHSLRHLSLAELEATLEDDDE